MGMGFKAVGYFFRENDLVVIIRNKKDYSWFLNDLFKAQCHDISKR